MTGQEVVSKINEVYTELFGNLYEKISGKDGALDPYIIGYYDKKTQLNPIIDSNKFINEMMKNILKEWLWKIKISYDQDYNKFLKLAEMKGRL